jgi:hypothetical protein
VRVKAGILQCVWVETPAFVLDAERNAVRQQAIGEAYRLGGVVLVAPFNGVAHNFLEGKAQFASFFLGQAGGQHALCKPLEPLGLCIAGRRDQLHKRAFVYTAHGGRRMAWGAAGLWAARPFG